MLFSEPKIPQCPPQQRPRSVTVKVSVLFSEPKIPQSQRSPREPLFQRARFSALQRAENSSIFILKRLQRALQMFQCSSASRKFLNRSRTHLPTETTAPFQCSSASRKFLNALQSAMLRCARRVSVLFSEPKIPQSDYKEAVALVETVSVLFSEPKIPQSEPTQYEIVNDLDVSVLFSEPKIPQ